MFMSRHHHQKTGELAGPKYRYEHFAPEGQISSVQEVADRLLPAYKVDGGSVHLAGCRMENRLFVRVSACHAGKTTTFFLDEHGEELDPALGESLGVDHLEKLEHPAEENGDKWVESLATVARSRMIQRFDAKNPPEVVDVVAVWCKHVEGRLRFTIGSELVDLPFSDWVRTLRPGAYHCPRSGVDSFHLAATDDHQIVPVEAIGVCEETGRRVLCSELVTCSETGRRLVAKLTEICPVSGKPVGSKHLIVCEHCGQRVAPSTVDRGWCFACRTRVQVKKDDPRLVRLAEQNPELDLVGWNGWQLAETGHILVATANRWFRQLLLVADAKTGKLLRFAKRVRPFGDWNEVGLK